VSKCFYTQPVWKKQTALKNGLSAAANKGASECPNNTPRSLLAPAPAAPGFGDGGLWSRRTECTTCVCSASGETPALRAEFENRADGTWLVGSPSRPTTLRPTGRTGERPARGARGWIFFARSRRRGARARTDSVSNVRQ
jgi:hypothetical protein